MNNHEMDARLINKRILVTGGAGFIGSNLVEYFLKANDVICLDNLSAGFLKNISPFLDDEGFTFIEGDVRDPETCRKAVEGCDYVFHQAALGSVPRSVADPVATNASNIDGFLNMLVAARDAGVKRFIYAASSSSYGDSAELPKIEHRIGKPLSPYAITKYVNELYAGNFTKLYGIETIGLRYFNVYGKRQDPFGAYAAVIPLWVDALLHHRSPVINGDGNYSRDFTCINDVVQANELAAATGWNLLCERLRSYNESINPDRDLEMVFNIAFGGNTTLTELFSTLREKLKAFDPAAGKVEPVYGPERAGDIPHSQACIKKAATVLQYEPEFNLQQGIQVAVEWYCKNLKLRQVPEQDVL